jgi:hypothetical protein
MDQKNIPTSLAPELFLTSISGDLLVKGWDRPEVQIRADLTELTAEEKDDVVKMSCQGDCSIRLPTNATIQLETVRGDSRFKLLDDSLTIQHASGELVLRSVGDVTVGQVNGNLMVRQVKGDLHVEKVNGNAHLREVQGDCVLNRVNGNLELHNAHGEIHASADGNIRLRLSELPEGSHHLDAKGNLVCELTSGARALLKIHSAGNAIRLRLPENQQTYNQKDLELTIGKDLETQTLTTLELEAKGEVVIESLDSGRGGYGEGDEDEETFPGLSSEFAERIARQVETQIEAQMESMTRQMNEQFSRMSEAFTQEGMNDEDAERIVEEAREKGERAAEEARERMARAQEKLERKLDAHRRRAEAQAHAAEKRAQSASRRGWHFEWNAPKPPAPPPPAASAATEEERLMILKMLEQKKITLEEATKLLEALDGKTA